MNKSKSMWFNIYALLCFVVIFGLMPFYANYHTKYLTSDRCIEYGYHKILRMVSFSGLLVLYFGIINTLLIGYKNKKDMLSLNIGIQTSLLVANFIFIVFMSIVSHSKYIKHICTPQELWFGKFYFTIPLTFALIGYKCRFF